MAEEEPLPSGVSQGEPGSRSTHLKWDVSDSGQEAERRQLLAFRQALMTSTPRVYFTPALLAANVGLWVAMVVYGVDAMSPSVDDLVRWGANYVPRTVGGEWWRLLSSAFIHIGLFHLLINMWALWNVGRFVERLLGNAGYLSLYLLAGLGGSLASVAWRPQICSAGASGAIFGVFGAFLACLIRHRRMIPAGARSSMWRNAAVFGAINIGYGMMNPAIDNAAHLGGLASGFLAGLLLARPLAAEPKLGSWRRAGVVAAGGMLLLVLGAAALPRNVVDFRVEANRAIAESEQAGKAFAEATARYLKKEMGLQQYKAIIDRECLARWRGIEQRLKSVSGVPAKHQDWIDKFIDYARARVKEVAGFVRQMEADAASSSSDRPASDLSPPTSLLPSEP